MCVCVFSSVCIHTQCMCVYMQEFSDKYDIALGFFRHKQRHTVHVVTAKGAATLAVMWASVFVSVQSVHTQCFPCASSEL